MVDLAAFLVSADAGLPSRDERGSLAARQLAATGSDERSLVNDIKCKFLVVSYAQRYSPRVLVQWSLSYYMPHNACMCVCFFQQVCCVAQLVMCDRKINKCSWAL